MMKYLRNLKLFFTFIALFQGLLLNSQGYQAMVHIHEVPDSGFYTIPLLPAQKAFAKQDLSNIRIRDKNMEIPYIVKIKEYMRWGPEKIFVALDTANYQVRTGIHKTTEIIILNALLHKHEQFVLEIKHSEIQKHWQISGSDDKANWYAISDDKPFGGYAWSASQSTYKTVDFEAVAYKYYKINIDDSLHKPYRILSIGTLGTMYIPGEMAPVTDFRTSIKEDTKSAKTIVLLTCPYPVNVSELQFRISVPGFFKRDATMFYLPAGEKTMIEHDHFSISSSSHDSIFHYNIPEIYTTSIRIEIANGDNTPLHFKNISCFQFATYLVAYLKPGENYDLFYGNYNTQKPVYDLEYFKDKIPAELPVATLGEVHKIAKINRPQPLPAFWEQAWFLWCCIGFGGLLTLYVAITLLKDIRKTED
jgi:hypothetical protein